MKNNNNTITPEENYEEWLNNKLCDDSYVSTFSEGILSKPQFVLSSTQSDFDKQPLYSASQMLDMFRLGFTSMSKTDFGMELVTKQRPFSRAPRPYPTLRQLEKGQTITFPYSSWKAVRTAASKLKAEFGVAFRVSKTSPQGEIGDIKVIRLA